ncbi:hypothetical protein HHI36_005713 [Cryptolaemus montrouzieri]|uniref:Uncharacterized protein n=1 Tax=Cryptolaemus montrouzieri TaxID=559131 RepID=A0ABD2NVF9_9CUCU
MDEGYEKGLSDNLPKIDGLMVDLYFAKNSEFFAAEILARDNYGDDAVGYVQIRRTDNTCTVKCRITPEHLLRTKPYHCSLVCDENEEKFLDVTCDD